MTPVILCILIPYLFIGLMAAKESQHAGYSKIWRFLVLIFWPLALGFMLVEGLLDIIKDIFTD